MTSFVLVHGAYQGGWIWKLVAERLRAAGHAVYALSLDGCAERAPQLRAGIDTESQGEEIAGLMHFEDLTDVALVGTSSGGMVMAAAAERAHARASPAWPVDALALFDGETARHRQPPCRDQHRTGAGPSRGRGRQPHVRRHGPIARRMGGRSHHAHPIKCFTQPVKLPSFWQQSWNASVILLPAGAEPVSLTSAAAPTSSRRAGT